MAAVIVIIICLLLNAVLSCVEMAFVTVSKPHLRKLAKDGDRLAMRLLKLRMNPERVLSILQIGITLVGAVSAAVSGAGAEERLAPYLQSLFNISKQVAASISIAIVVFVITYFSVVIGELVPKTLALRSPMVFARFGALFLVYLDKLFSPIIFILELSTKLLVNPLLDLFKKENYIESTSAVDIDSLSDSHKQYVFNLLSVDGRKAKDIMVPWEKVTTIPIESNAFEIINVLRESRYARIPVIENKQPVGMLNYREFFSEPEMSKLDWRMLIKPLLFIKSEDSILNVLKLLQTKNIHMATVKKGDEVIGIVTLEDIIEEIVGEIYDEDDNAEVLLSTNSRIRTMGLQKK